MPIRTAKRSSKKKKGFFDRIPGSKIAANTLKDFEDIAKSTPAGVYEAGRAVGDLVNPTATYKGGKFTTPNHTRRASNLAKAQLTAVTDLKHPLRHPGYSLLTILGLLPLPSTLATKGAEVGLFGKAAAGAAKASRVRTRSLVYKTKNGAEAERFQKALGSPRPARTVRVELPAARPVTTRLAQKGLDKARSKSSTMQRRKVEKTIARQQDIRGRMFDENPKGIIGSTKEAFGTTGPIKQLDPRKHGKAAKESARELNALVRGLRLYRGAYIPPNRLGSEFVNLIHSGPTRYAKAVPNQVRSRIKNRSQAKEIDRLGGETVGQAMMNTGGDAATSGPIGTFMRGVGTTLGKVTDLGPRNRIWREEARRHGYETDADIQTLLGSAKGGNAKSLRDLSLITDRAERGAIKFSRTGPMRDIASGNNLTKRGAVSAVDRALADNIFLYKWLTASTRYGGHMLGEHPTLSAVLANLGQEGPSIDDVLKEHPSFMDNYIPTGEFDKNGNPLVRNPTAAGLFDMPFETLDTLKRANPLSTSGDFREISDLFNPVQATLWNAGWGYDPFRDEEIKKGQDSLIERLNFGQRTQTRSIPWLEWLRLSESEKSRQHRLFPLTPSDIIERQTAGSSLTPTGFPVNRKVAASMARKEKNKGKTKRGRKRRSQGY